MPRALSIIQVFLSLMIICVLVMGCEKLPAISTTNSVLKDTASEYQADINGRVTIAEAVQAKYDRNKPDTMELTPLEGKIFWIVDISVINKTYKGEITASYQDWKIVADDNVYDAGRGFMGVQLSVAMNAPVGGTGKTVSLFSVPDTLKVSDAKLCYQGQEPYSYGELTGGDIVAVYDWDSKTVIKEQQQKQQSVFFDKWEFTLESYSIRSNNIDVNIAVTSHFNTPNTYQLSDLGGIVGIDQYGKVFGDTIEEEIITQNLRDFKNNPSDYLLGIKEYKDECFFDGEYYPGDTKVGNLKFVVNQKSGKISLWLYCKSYNPIKLFDLGEIK